MTTISEIFANCQLPFSIEIFPPKGELTVEGTREILDGMAKARPDFISVTCSAGGSGNGSNTITLANLVQTEVSIPAVAHLTCINSTREGIKASISAMKDVGIENVLALRGDRIEGNGIDAQAEVMADSLKTNHGSGSSPCFSYAKELIPILKDAGFCVGAAAYPEGHINCLDLDLDVRYLKEKQDAGADFFVTQLCFDNNAFYRFRDRAERLGITKPIICGIMPFLGKSQIQRMVFLCGSSLPAKIIKLLAKYEHDPEALRRAGIEYACDQLVDLGRHGADGLHIYSMDHPDIAQASSNALIEAGLRE